MITEIPAGFSIHQSVEHALWFAQVLDQTVQFDFNGITMYVNPKSFSADVVENYLLKHKIRQLESRA